MGKRKKKESVSSDYESQEEEEEEGEEEEEPSEEVSGSQQDDTEEESIEEESKSKNIKKKKSKPKREGDFSQYEELEDKFNTLKEELRESISQNPLAVFDDNVREALIMAMNEALVYRPDNPCKFFAGNLKEFNKNVGGSGGGD